MKKYLLLAIALFSFNAMSYDTIDDYRSSSNYHSYKTNNSNYNKAMRSKTLSDPSYRVEQGVCLSGDCRDRGQISVSDRDIVVGTDVKGFKVQFKPKACGKWFNDNCR